jgi:hypothetical protein
MYFTAQRVRKPALRTTNHGWASTYPVSHNGGRVIQRTVTYFLCLSFGVQVSSLSQFFMKTYTLLRDTYEASEEKR